MELYDINGNLIDDSFPKDYYENEIETTVESILALQTEPCVTFALVTDPHYLSVPSENEGSCLNVYAFEDCTRNIKAVAKKVKLDFVFCNGDFTNGAIAKNLTIERVGKMMDRFRSIGIPFACSVGNHDDNRYGTTNLTSEEIYGVYVGQSSLAVSEYGSMNGTNYYFDYPRLKIRFIVINSNNFSGAYEFTASTRTFVSDTLASMPENYQGFIFSHTPPNSKMNYDNRTRSGGTALETIINESGRMCAMFYGHCHQDNSWGAEGSGAINTNPYLAIATCCQKCTNENGDSSKWSAGATMPTRTVGTYTEDLWDVVVIRPTSRKINMVRFGAGSDREFSY